MSAKKEGRQSDCVSNRDASRDVSDREKERTREDRMCLVERRRPKNTLELLIGEVARRSQTRPAEGRAKKTRRRGQRSRGSAAVELDREGKSRTHSSRMKILLQMESRAT